MGRARKIKPPVDTTLQALVGERVLTGVDTYCESIQRYDWRGAEDCNVVRFRLDGVTYCVIEDPSDGYRSSMDKIFIEDAPIKNRFPRCKVLARIRTSSRHHTQDDVLELIDVKTGKVVLEVGTANTDDYYPYFVGTFSPENMAANANKAAA